MHADLLKTLALPLALMVVMFGMGMGLRLEDFRRVFVSPRAKWLGLCCQLLMLPALAFALAHLFRLPGELAVGLMLVAACPGGPTSNVISHLSRGDTALSVTLTALSSIVTVFSIPLVVGASSGYFLGAAAEVSLPFGRTVMQLAVVTLLPIGLGMAMNSWRGDLCRRLERPFHVLAIAFLAIIILAAVLREESLGRQFALAGPAALALNISGMLLGAAAALVFRLERSQRVTISVEVGIQNGTLALAIALGLMDSPRVAIPAVVYSLLMFATGALIILNSARKPKDGTEAVRRGGNGA